MNATDINNFEKQNPPGSIIPIVKAYTLEELKQYYRCVLIVERAEEIGTLKFGTDAQPITGRAGLPITYTTMNSVKPVLLTPGVAQFKNKPAAVPSRKAASLSVGITPRLKVKLRRLKENSNIKDFIIRELEEKTLSLIFYGFFLYKNLNAFKESTNVANNNVDYFLSGELEDNAASARANTGQRTLTSLTSPKLNPSDVSALLKTLPNLRLHNSKTSFRSSTSKGFRSKIYKKKGFLGGSRGGGEITVPGQEIYWQRGGLYEMTDRWTQDATDEYLGSIRPLITNANELLLGDTAQSNRIGGGGSIIVLRDIYDGDLEQPLIQYEGTMRNGLYVIDDIFRTFYLTERGNPDQIILPRNDDISGITEPIDNNRDTTRDTFQVFNSEQFIRSLLNYNNDYNPRTCYISMRVSGYIATLEHLFAIKDGICGGFVASEWSLENFRQFLIQNGVGVTDPRFEMYLTKFKLLILLLHPLASHVPNVQKADQPLLDLIFDPDDNNAAYFVWYDINSFNNTTTGRPSRSGNRYWYSGDTHHNGRSRGWRTDGTTWAPNNYPVRLADGTTFDSNWDYRRTIRNIWINTTIEVINNYLVCDETPTGDLQPNYISQYLSVFRLDRLRNLDLNVEREELENESQSEINNDPNLEFEDDESENDMTY